MVLKFLFLQYSIAIRRFFCLFFVCFFPAWVWGGNQPRWEAGVGVVSGLFPHYLGSNHYYRFTLPVPVFFYRTDRAEVGQNSKLLFFESDSFIVDLGLGGRVPVESADVDDDKPEGADNAGAEIYEAKNYTRRGMPNLLFSFFWGVHLKWYLTDNLVLDLPYLNGVTVGGGFGHVGNIYTPEISYDFFGRDSDNRLALSASWLYADANYNNFYYGVTSDDVLEDRAEYEADAGLVALTYQVAGNVDVTDQFSLFGVYSFNTIADSSVEESPLVVSPYSRSYGVGFTYSFLQSSEMVRTWK